MSASNPSRVSGRSREPLDESSFIAQFIGGVAGDIRRQRSSCELSRLREGAATAPIFVLVHGTSTADAAWTKLDALLPQEILTVWSDAGLFAFKWPGHNRMGEAASAAFALSESVNGLRRTYPNSRIILLAHGYGGNVVAWASTMTEAIDSAVYLDTPFLEFLQGEFLDGKPSLLFPTVIWLLMLPIGLAVLALHPLIESLIGPWGFGLGLGPILRFVALVLVATYFAGKIARQIESKVRGYRLLLIAMCSAPRQIRRELVVHLNRATFTALTVFRRLQVVISRITQFPLRVVFGTRGASTLILILLFLFYRRLPPEGQTAMLLVCGSVFGLYYVMIIGAMLLYGPIHGLMAADSTLVASTTPRGASESITVGVEGSGRKRPQVYGERPVVAAVIDWLRKDDQSPPTTSI